MKLKIKKLFLHRLSIKMYENIYTCIPFLVLLFNIKHEGGRQGLHVTGC